LQVLTPCAGALRGEIGGLRPLDPSQGSLGQSKDNLAQTVNKPFQNRLVQSKNAHSGEICKGKGELEAEGLQSGEQDGCGLMFEVAGVEAGVAQHLHSFGRNVGNQERDGIQAEQVTVLWVIIEKVSRSRIQPLYYKYYLYGLISYHLCYN